MTISFKYGAEDVVHRTANKDYRSLLSNVIKGGHWIAPRGMKCLELLNAHTLVSMDFPRMTIPERKIGEKFRYAEAWWILSGRNDVDSIYPYSKAIAQFSDDGFYFAGAYGPKVVDQLSYVADCLRKDRDTRQAVMSIWRENLRFTKDVPCTLSLQFLIREGALHCVTTMRSSDLWLGWPYDVFNFSMIARRIFEMITDSNLRPGYLCINHGSLHLYEHNLEDAKKVADALPPEDDGYFPWDTCVSAGTRIIETLAFLKDHPDET